MCESFMFGPCSAMQYLVFILVLQSSRYVRGNRLLYFDCALAVMRLIVFCVPFSKYRGLVCESGLYWWFTLVLLSGFSLIRFEVIKLYSWSTQLSTKFQLLRKTKIPTNEEVSGLKSLWCCIYHATMLRCQQLWHDNIYEQDKFRAQLSWVYKKVL